MKMFRREVLPTPPPTGPQFNSRNTQTITLRRIEVTVEREWARELIPMSQTPFIRLETFCAGCGQRVSMLSPTPAAAAPVTVRSIYRWVDEKKLHFIESPAGDLYVCARSLQAAPQPPIPIKQLISGTPQ
jgi:hypothetical protein